MDYTTATTFTQVTAGTLAAGDCVTVTGTPATGSSQALTATSIRIVAKVNGTCPAAGANNAGGAPGGGGISQRPSGAPTGTPGGTPTFASATGTLSSVNGSTILVQGVFRGSPNAASGTTAATPTTITVTTTASSTVTQTVAATSAAAVVGQCASAVGTANSVGAIAASSITISTPGPNGCRTGFGGGGAAGAGGSHA